MMSVTINADEEMLGSFFATVRFLDRHMTSQTLDLVVRLTVGNKTLTDRYGKLPLVPFDGEYEICFPGRDGFGRFLLTVHRIERDHHPIDIHQLKEL